MPSLQQISHEERKHHSTVIVIMNKYNKDTVYGNNYTALLPSKWTNQRLGLLLQTHLANHIKASLTKLRFSNEDNTLEQPKIDEGQEGDWKYYDGPMLGEGKEGGVDGSTELDGNVDEINGISSSSGTQTSQQKSGMGKQIRKSSGVTKRSLSLVPYGTRK